MNRICGVTRIFAAGTLFLVWPASAALDRSFDIGKNIQDVWDTDSGLPQNTVESLAQTSDGYLWAGTESGLARFDGVRFTVFDKENTPELKSNEITALLADKQNNLWIGTNGGGLVRYRSGKFSTYGPTSGLTSQVVRALYMDRSGVLWIGTDGGGLDQLGGGKIRAFTRREGLPDDTVFSLTGSSDGSIWIGTEGGFARLQSGKVTSFSAGDDKTNANQRVRSIYVDSHNTVWLGTNGAGLSRFSDGHMVTYTTAQGLSSNTVWCIREDQSGTLWIGTAGGGLDRFDGSKFSSYSVQQGLTSDSIWSLLEDFEGSFWLGTSGGGLVRLRGGSVSVIASKDGLSSNVTLPVFEDSAGAVWAGTRNGLNRVTGGEIKRYTTKDGLSDNLVFSLAEDRHRDLWVGTHSGLNRLHNGKFRVYHSGAGIRDDVIFSLYTDHTGRLWIGTRGGLSYFEGERFHTYTTEDGLSSNFIISIYEDVHGALWVGTGGGGLDSFENGRFRKFSGENGSVSGVIYSIGGEPNGTLWLGTNGGGLVRYKNGKFTALTSKAGFFEDSIFAMVQDGHGSAWLSSNRGIFRVAMQDLNSFADHRFPHLNYREFGQPDGMKSRECNGGFQPAAWKTRDGRLLFPTMKGIAVIDPEHLSLNHSPPPVSIEAVLSDRTSFDPIQTVRLPPGKGQLEFQFTAPSFVSSGRIRFAYKLEGFDKDWVDAGTRRAAFYTNLPPGDYTFHVIACNSEGVWNTEGASKSLTLLPHFYETRSFAAFTLLLAGALFAAAYRLRMRHIRVNETKLVMLVDERTRALAHRSQALQESEKRFRQLAENISEVFWIFDPQSGKFVYLSPAYREIWQQDPELVLNDASEWYACIHPSDAGAFTKAKETQFAGAAASCEYRIIRGDGSIRWVWDRSFPIHDGSGQVNRVVGIVEDMTERKQAQDTLRTSRDELAQRVLDLKAENQERQRAEEQLKVAKELAEAGSQAKSEFLANMSHEIRTPLNGILGMTQLTLDSDLAPEQRECLELAAMSADSLLGIINDILDFSKIEARKLHLESIEFDLRKCLDKTIRPLAIRAQQRRIELMCHVEPEVPELLVGDPVRLNQIVVNLVGNAIKFTEDGEIVVSVRMKPRKGNCLRLEFTVADTGIGIPEERQKAIFEAFTQADGSSTRKYGGTGLGLSIASQLVGMMGGEIWVKSKVGEGSTFGLEVSLGAAAQPIAISSPPLLTGKTILIVDDNRTNCDFIHRALSDAGADAVIAMDGSTAINELRFRAGAYDLVLLDADMPGMQALELVPRIRAECGFSGKFVAMLTSGKELGAAQRYRELGVYVYVSKPVDYTQIASIAARALLGATGEPEARREPSSPPAANAKLGLRILLAEDNPVNQKLAVRLLEKKGCTVMTAVNGRLALQMLNELRWNVDMLLTDVQMPEMDGYQTTAAIREYERVHGGHLPVVAMTAHALDRDRERCLAAGMDGYVSKPIQADKLFQMIESIMLQLQPLGA